MRPPIYMLLAVLFAMPDALLAQPASLPGDEPGNGGFSEVKFTERSPFSSVEAQRRRHQLKVEPGDRYDLSTETFAAFVPENFDEKDDKPWGLIVWVNAGKSGTPSRGWAPILANHRLIWIGPNNVGNERGITARIGLALDAAYNFKKQYNIDPARIYVAGVSGGAKIATMLAILYPDEFNGALAMAGTTYFRPIPLSGDPSRSWQAAFSQAPGAMLDRAKAQGRFALLTGTKDINRDSVRDTYHAGFLADGFKHVKYVEIEDMAHGVPEAKWVEEAIDSLDAPLAIVAKEQLIRAQQFEKSGRIADAVSLYAQVALHGDESVAAKAKERLGELKLKAAEIVSPPAEEPAAPPVKPAPTVEKPPSDEAEAASLLSLASNYERNSLYTKAVERLEKILKDYPKTKAAAQAKVALERVKAKQR